MLNMCKFKNKTESSRINAGIFTLNKIEKSCLIIRYLDGGQAYFPWQIGLDREQTLSLHKASHSHIQDF